MSPKRKYLALAITLIALIDLGVSGYLSWVALEASKVVGCGAESGFDCDQVLASRWSKWLGLPVSLFGTLTYVGILAFCWPAAAQPRSWAMTGLLTLSMMAAGAAAWFIGLQAFLIGSYCLYCMTAHCCGLVIAVLTLLMFIDGQRSGGDVDPMQALLGVAAEVEAPAPADSRGLFVSLAVATVGLMILVGGQVFVEPPEAMVMEEVELPTIASDPPAEDSSEPSPPAIDTEAAFEMAVGAESEEQTPFLPTDSPRSIPEPETLTESAPPVEAIDLPPADSAAAVQTPEPSSMPVPPEAPTTPIEPEGDVVIATDQETLGESDDLSWLEEDSDTIDASSRDSAPSVATLPTAEPTTPTMPTVDSLLGSIEKPSTDSGPRMLVYNNLPEPVDPRQLPILGDPDAPHVVVEMMDYTCKHCRHLHPRIHASLERYGDQVAFLIYHCPLSKDCNPHMRKTGPGKKYACDYAQLALGVWKLAPKKFPEFHDWLMEGDRAPLITKARSRAIELVGMELLTESKYKAEISRRLGEQCTTLNRLKSGLPLLLFSQGALRGVPKTDEQWFEYLEDKLGLNPELATLE